jgi:hypothetical protein
MVVELAVALVDYLRHQLLYLLELLTQLLLALGVREQQVQAMEQAGLILFFLLLLPVSVAAVEAVAVMELQAVQAEAG